MPLAFLVYFLFEGRTPVFAGVMSVFIMVGIWFYRNVTEFLGTLRRGDKTIADDDIRFCAGHFLGIRRSSYLHFSRFLSWVSGCHWGYMEKPTWSAGQLRAALSMIVTGFVLVSVFTLALLSWAG